MEGAFLSIEPPSSVTAPNSGGTRGSYLGASSARGFFNRRQVRAPSGERRSSFGDGFELPHGLAPKISGMRAPIVTTTNIVPKKIAGEPV